MIEQEIQRLEIDMKLITRIPDDPVGLEEYVGSDDWNKVHDVLARLEELAQSGPSGQEQVVALRDKYWSGDLAELVSPLSYPSGFTTNPAYSALVEQQLALHDASVTAAILQARFAVEALAHGYYVRVFQNEEVIPSEHTERYLVIKHHHPNEAEFGKDHALKTIANTHDYDKALKTFLAASTRINDPETNVRLVAAFPYGKLSLFHDGTPLSGTGLLLARTDWEALGSDNIPKKHVGIGHGIHLPVAVITAQIARLDYETGKLKFFDERLKPLTAVTMAQKRDQLLTTRSKRFSRRKGRSL